LFDLSGMFVVDDFEHEGEEGAEDFVAVLEVEAHVERLDVGKILQQVEVSEKQKLKIIPEMQIAKCFTLFL
jgi:hypothetical protein